MRRNAYAFYSFSVSLDDMLDCRICQLSAVKGKKIMKRTLKLFGIVYFAFAGMLLFGANAMAYIDPSVMTYLIQAIAGVVIAVGAVVGIYWRKAKKKVNEKLGIDENRNKEVESDDIIVEAEAETDSEKTEEN